ncbi:type IV secretion protein Rhs, partial [Xenorhabdus khoisanae]
MKTQSTEFYSQASNFITAVSGGVDPRVGLFNVNLPLANLHSSALAGPALSLSLMYNPLSDVNNGFGSGFSLNFSSCDTRTGKLQLSSGEEYRVDTRTMVVKQKKLKNFILKKTDDTHCLIIHKTGLTELLSLIREVYVPTRITAPDGRGLTLTWNSTFSPARLAQVTDDEGTVLCTITYPNESVGSTKFTLQPDDDAGFSIVFRFTNEYLISVISQASEQALVWSFAYDDVGPERNYRAITEITSPTGLKEKAEYYTDSGMKFPEIAKLPDLPCVYQHTVIPGSGQPPSITLWTWTQKNYLGRDAGLNQWQPDTDGMLNILLADYQYGSTEKMVDIDGSTALKTITRRYNSYHLQVSETTLRDGKIYSLTTEYHATPNVTFDNQPAQYALPISQTESWDDGSGAAPCTRITRTQFDGAANPLHQETPDGTVTEYIYYPAKGEDGRCPADPYGFTRYLKSITVTPRQVQGDEPTTVTTSTWKKQKILRGDGYAVVANSVTEITGNTRTVITREYYDDTADILRFGREKARKTVLTPDVTSRETFTSYQSFAYCATEQGLIQSETFTGHDDLTATRSTLRHAYMGYLLSETDAQGVTVTHSYDKIGRLLTRTMSPDTNHENTTSWSYAIEDTGPVTTETDASGNQLKTYFDGAGRDIRLQRFDKDETQTWFEVSSRTYNALGEVASGTGSDWLTGLSEHYNINM